jgi:hypothetical protein
MCDYSPTMSAGTYHIKAGDVFYIGSSTNFEKRKRDHSWRLRNGKHPVAALQKAFDAHGSAAFMVLDFARQPHTESEKSFRDRLREMEQARINDFIGNPNFANVSKNARGPYIRPDAANRWKDPVYREMMANFMNARKGIPVSAETREKMAHAKRGANNVKSRPVVVTSPDGKKKKFASVSEAAAFCGASQQLMDTWMKGTAAWPGTGTRAPRHKYAWLVGYSASYE